MIELNKNLGCTGRGERDHEQCGREQASGFHREIIARGAALPRYPGLAQNAGQCDNRYMQRSLTSTLLLAAGMILAGDAYAQQTPASTPAATTPAAPAATTPKAATTAKTPAKKTGTAAKSAEAAPRLTHPPQKFTFPPTITISTLL